MYFSKDLFIKYNEWLHTLCKYPRHLEDRNSFRIEENINNQINYCKNIEGYYFDCDYFVVKNEKGEIVSFPPNTNADSYTKELFGTIQNNFNVVSIPGSTAFVSALITSNIEPLPFTFLGFLNSKSSKRKKELEVLRNYNSTLIFYESPHRLLETLNDMLEVLGNRKCSISREITKKFETIYRGTLKDIINEFDTIKGEFVIVVEGNKDVNTFSNLSIIEHVNLYIKEGMDSKEAIKKVAKERQLSKNEVYSEYHKRGA